MKYNSQKQARQNQIQSSTADDKAAKAAEAKKRYEREIEVLARLVNKFRVDGQRFFAGDLPLPPDELREQVSQSLRRLQNSKLATSANRFRLGSLEAQFNSHLELFGRRLREREHGNAVRAAERPELQHDPQQGVLAGREGAAEALYKALYLRRGKGKPKIDLERFRKRLEKQADSIRTKTGCAEIQFRVAEEGGKMKIKAKPIKKAGA